MMEQESNIICTRDGGHMIYACGYVPRDVRKVKRGLLLGQPEDVRIKKRVEVFPRERAALELVFWAQRVCRAYFVFLSDGQAIFF